MNEDSVSDTASEILTYHRIVEAFKFAYAKRSALADEDFADVSAVRVNHICFRQLPSQDQ